ncbi:MAG: hypothetical protein JO364_09415 [Pseudonocardiales bacterium]|nr:hypothetical protein [Pseudonocardiales bacterium]
MTALSVPGTHNSGCVGSLFGFAQTQNPALSDQLDAGIRFLDIRLAQCPSNLSVHHDVVCMDKSYVGILATCSDFLEKHPSETILMSVEDEGPLGDEPDRSTPSEVLRKLSIKNAENEDGRVSSFEDTLKARTWEHVAGSPLFYNFAARRTRGGPMAAVRALTSETTLGEVRGRIVLLRRSEGSQDAGLDLTYWPDNQTFRSAAPPVHDVHDRYQGLTEEDKLELIVIHIEEAKKSDLKDLYITFSSAAEFTASDYAKAINPRLSDYLARPPRGRVGIIVMDYFENPPELVSNVIEMNQTSRLTGGASWSRLMM